MKDCQKSKSKSCKLTLSYAQYCQSSWSGQQCLQWFLPVCNGCFQTQPSIAFLAMQTVLVMTGTCRAEQADNAVQRVRVRTRVWVRMVLNACSMQNSAVPFRHGVVYSISCLEFWFSFTNTDSIKHVWNDCYIYSLLLWRLPVVFFFF